MKTATEINNNIIKKLYNISTYMIFISCIVFFFLIKNVVDRSQKKEYCGKVVKVYMVAAGYKVSANRHVVFYNDVLKRNIDVKVTNQTYVNVLEGQIVCFNLDRIQLEE